MGQSILRTFRNPDNYCSCSCRVEPVGMLWSMIHRLGRSTLAKPDVFVGGLHALRRWKWHLRVRQPSANWMWPAARSARTRVEH